MIALLIASHFVLAALGLWVGRRIVRSGLSRELPRLRDTASELSGSAEQVGIISRDLAAASQEQIDSLCTTMSASHEIRSMVETTSKNSAVLSQDARDLRELAGNGARTLEKMVQSSQEIKDGAEQFSVEMQESVAQLMQALGVIQEIAHKTKLINEIVFQTKLLSFNASVEAARAGESGKGFAVVAEEVGRLAQLSGTASLEINQIVDRSVVVVQQAIETTKNKISTLADQTIQRGDAGYRDAKSCELIFNEMTGKITQVAQMIEQISVAAQEQAAGVTQLDQSIGSLQEVADRNRLVASQTTEYGREFETQTGVLTKALTALGSLSKMVAPKRVLQKFVWNKQLDLGVKAMDDEHKILVDRINSLVVALEARTSKVADAKLLNAFRALKNYTIEHFTHEEQFLDEIGYAQASSHKKIHEKLLGQVAAYEKQLEDGTLDDEKLVLFLRNWLISHIMGVDMQYAEFHKSSSHGAPARASRTA